MDSFLKGFSDELVKIGTPVSVAKPLQKASNIRPASSGPLNSIKTQTIKTWGRKPDRGYRSTGKHIPRTIAKIPTPKVVKKVRRKKRRTDNAPTAGIGDRRLPGEHGMSFAMRRFKEKSDWSKEKKRTQAAGTPPNSMTTQSKITPSINRAKGFRSGQQMKRSKSDLKVLNLRNMYRGGKM